MEIKWEPVEANKWQEFFSCMIGHYKCYLHIIYNRTKWEREQILENWHTTVSVYIDSKKIEQVEIPAPEPFENVTEYCTNFANEFLLKNYLVALVAKSFLEKKTTEKE